VMLHLNKHWRSDNVLQVKKKKKKKQSWLFLHTFTLARDSSSTP
jgi:hypothetical protein